MLNKQHVIGIRCHNFGESEAFLYQTLLEFFHKDAIFFIVDELDKTKSFPESLHKFSLNTHFIETHGLYNKGKIAWAYGDYFYYVFYKAVSADFYWLIEPDVLLNLDSVGKFFEFFANQPDEALVTHFSPTDEGWSWYESAKILLDPPYRCFFPLTRLSKRSIEILYAKRQSLSADFFAGKYTGSFPNDEALLANALMAVGVQPVNLTDYFPEQFNFFSIHPFKHKDLSIRYHKDQILHPVKQVDFYKNLIKTQLEALFEHRLPRTLRQAMLDEAELQDLRCYANNLFSQWMDESFYTPARLNFILKKLGLYFKQDTNLHFKRARVVDNELSFFMGQVKAIVFVVESETIKVYKRIYGQGLSEPNPQPLTETLLQVWPIQLLDSFDLLQKQVAQILQAHENKQAALKQQQSLQASKLFVSVTD